MTQHRNIRPASSPKIGLKPWIMWALATIFYCYEFMLQVSPNVMKEDLMADFALTGTTFGTLVAFTTLAYMSMQIPAGVMLDRLGPRRLLTLSTLLCAFGVLLFGSAHTFSVAAAGRFLIGLGSAFAIISCFRVAASWFPNSRFALISCLTVMIGMFGAAGGGLPIAALVQSISWRPSMMFFAVFGFVLAALLWLVVRDKPDVDANGASHADDYASKQEPLLAGLFKVAAHRQTWICAIYGGLMFAPTIAFGGLWSSTFFVNMHELNLDQASKLTTILYLGWAVGAPLAGGVSDYIGRRLPLMVIGSIGALVAISAIIYIPMLPFGVLALLVALFGFFSSGFFTVFALVKESHPTKRAGTAMGFMNMLNMAGGIILQPLIGFILDKLSNGVLENGVPVFSKMSYTWAMSTLPICIILAIMLIPFIKETYCKNIADLEKDQDTCDAPAADSILKFEQEPVTSS